MIEVNLLPGELRRVEHTPLPRFLVVIVGTAAIMATGAFGVMVNLRRVPDLRAKEAVLMADVARSTVQAAVYERLIEQIAETKDRKTAIAEIWRRRILWSEKLAQIAEMTPKFIGIQDMRFDGPRGGARPGVEEAGGMLTLGSICAGADHKRVANWRRIVKGEYPVKGSRDPWVGKRFFASFVELLPTGTQKVEVRDYVEKEALKFGLKLPVKSASVRLTEAVEAARAEQRHQQIEHRMPTRGGQRVTPKAAKPEQDEADARKPEEKTSAAEKTAPVMKEGVPVNEAQSPEGPPDAPAEEETTGENDSTPAATKPRETTSVEKEENKDE